MSDVIDRAKPRNKKQFYVWIGAGVLVGGVVIWRARAHAATSADVPATDGTDTSGDYTSTGTGEDYTNSAYGDYYPASGVGGTYYPNTGSSTVTTPSSTPISNNAEWAQAALSYLTSNGYDFTAASLAIGVYLASGTLTNDQLGIVQAALAVTGSPPTPPAAPHTAPPTGQTTPPPSSGSGGTSAAGVLPAPKLYVAAKPPGVPRVTLGWAAVPHAKSYAVHSLTGHAYYTTGTRITVPKPGTYWVFAEPATGYKASHASNRVTV